MEAGLAVSSVAFMKYYHGKKTQRCRLRLPRCPNTTVGEEKKTESLFSFTQLTRQSSSMQAGGGAGHEFF